MTIQGKGGAGTDFAVIPLVHGRIENRALLCSQANQEGGIVWEKQA